MHGLALPRFMTRAGVWFGLLCAVIFACSSPALPAESSPQQLYDLVQQLQADPGNTGLREQIIALSRITKPAPAIPEDARRSFIQGSTIAGAAQNADQQRLAVLSFQSALRAAPWWGEAYYNLAVAQELAGLFDAAEASLKLYILTTPGTVEARQAQDKIYALEAKAQLSTVSSAQADADRKKAAQEEQRRLLDGAVFVRDINIPNQNGGETRFFHIEISVHGTQVNKHVTRFVEGAAEPDLNCVLDGLRCDLYSYPAFRGELEFSSNGQTVAEKSYRKSDGVLIETLYYSRR